MNGDENANVEQEEEREFVLDEQEEDNLSDFFGRQRELLQEKGKIREIEISAFTEDGRRFINVQTQIYTKREQVQGRYDHIDDEDDPVWLQNTRTKVVNFLRECSHLKVKINALRLTGDERNHQFLVNLAEDVGGIEGLEIFEFTFNDPAGILQELPNVLDGLQFTEGRIWVSGINFEMLAQITNFFHASVRSCTIKFKERPTGIQRARLRQLRFRRYNSNIRPNGTIRLKRAPLRDINFYGNRPYFVSL